MFSETARQLLVTIHKPCTARGALVASEMPAAIEALRQAIAQSEAAGVPAEAESDEPAMLRPVIFKTRAWPLLDMLERSAKRGGSRAHITWEAPADF